MAKQYFEPEKDLAQFGKIGEWQPDLAKKFFDYYGESMSEGALTKREKILNPCSDVYATIFVISLMA